MPQLGLLSESMMLRTSYITRLSFGGFFCLYCRQLQRSTVGAFPSRVLEAALSVAYRSLEKSGIQTALEFCGVDIETCFEHAKVYVKWQQVAGQLLERLVASTAVHRTRVGG